MKKKPNETKTKTDKPKRSPQNAALVEKIKAVILDGKGIQRRIAEDLARPVRYSRDDGMFYDPAWQDEFIDFKPSPENTRRVLAAIKERSSRRQP